MPEDPKQRLQDRINNHHEVFTQDEVAAAGGPPPGYVMEPFIGNEAGESKFLANRLVRLRPIEESKKESRVAGAMGLGALSGALGPAIFGGGGAVAGALMGAAGQGTAAANENSMGNAVGNVLTQAPAEIATNTVLNMIPSGKGVGIAARMAAQGGAGMAQYAAEQAIANKVDQGNRPLTNAWATGLSGLGALAQGARDVMSGNYFVKNAAEARKLREQHGVPIDAIPRAEQGIENVDAAAARMRNEVELGRELGAALPKTETFRVEIPHAEEIAALEEAVKTGMKVPEKGLKIAAADKTAARQGLVADVDAYFDTEKARVRAQITDLQKSLSGVRSDDARNAIKQQIKDLNAHKLALEETKIKAKADIANRRPLAFSNENLQKQYEAYLEIAKREGQLKDFMETKVPEAEDALKIVQQKKALVDALQPIIKPTGQKNAGEDFFDILDKANFGDKESLVDLVTDAVMSGKAKFQAKFGPALSPATGINLVMDRLRASGGEDAVNAYRKVFFQRMLDKALEADGTYRKELKEAIGDTGAVLKAILRNPEDTTLQVAQKVNDFQKFWNRVIDDAPGKAKGGWTSSLRQWVVFDLSSHIIGVPAAAAIAGTNQIFKMYRTADLLQAMAGLSAKDFNTLTKQMQSIGPWRALHNNVQMREFMKNAAQINVTDAPGDGLPNITGPLNKKSDEYFDPDQVVFKAPGQ